MIAVKINILLLPSVPDSDIIAVESTINEEKMAKECLEHWKNYVESNDLAAWNMEYWENDQLVWADTFQPELIQ